jgi:4-amino-4-deoxy-L-arabinose transferase-like glycosyltransferase
MNGAGSISAPGGVRAAFLPAISRQRAALAGLLTAAVALRLLALWLVQPVVGNDTVGWKGPTFVPLSYHDLALGILNWDFAHDLGARSPGYPAFLALGFRLFGLDNWHAIAAMQSLLSLVLFISAYWLWSQLYGPGRAALLATATAVLEPVLVIAERTLLSETLSTVLLVLALALAIHAARRASPWVTAASGLCVAWLALARPAFQFLIPLLLVYLVLALGPQRRSLRGIAAMGLFALAAAAPVAAWNGFNYARFGYFTPMTTQGFILTSHSLPIALEAPERYARYADVVEIMARHKRAEGEMAIWLAYPEIMEQRNLSFVDASRLMQQFSMEVFRDRPVQYAKSAYNAFGHFWEPSLMAQDSWYDNVSFLFASKLYRALHAIGILLFFGVVAVDAARPGRWLRPGTLERLLMLGIVLMVCLASTMPIAIENARYNIPLLPLIWGVAVASLASNWARIRAFLASWQ